MELAYKKCTCGEILTQENTTKLAVTTENIQGKLVRLLWINCKKCHSTCVIDVLAKIKEVLTA